MWAACKALKPKNDITEDCQIQTGKEIFKHVACLRSSLRWNKATFRNNNEEGSKQEDAAREKSEG